MDPHDSKPSNIPLVLGDCTSLEAALKHISFLANLQVPINGAKRFATEILTPNLSIKTE